MLELDDIKKLHDKAYNYSQTTRENMARDLVFYWLTQWSEDALNDSQLLYRGEFNILRKAGRGILSDLAGNPAEVDFQPIDEDRDDAADILDGLYRTDSKHNSSLNAFAVGEQEAVVCGYGAWELYTEYESMRSDDNRNQVIRRKPLHEACTSVYFDPNAKLLDKSDSKHCSVIIPYSEDGYKDLVQELTGEELEKIDYNSFASPGQSNTFTWFTAGSTPQIYVGEFYHREKIKDKVFVMSDPIGQEITLREVAIKDGMDDLIDAGFEIVEEKTVNRWQVTKYIVSGSEILAHYILAGEHIPIVPVYGEHAIVDGQEHAEGVTRLAKDPQMLRNFQMSYLADIVSRSPRPKPIFWQEQIAGYEQMYEVSGAENNYPYLLQNRIAGDGSALPIGPVGVMPEQPIPAALIASIQLSRESVEDVANPGIPQDVADPDTSGKAILAMQNRLDMQSMIYQEHMKHAKRRDGEIYASMASELYDVPRKVWLTKPDGTREQVQLMETIMDKESGELISLRDINSVEFQVYSDIGPSYTSKREQTIERLTGLVSAMEPGNPMRQALLLKIVKLMDGVDFDDLRDYANRQLVLTGIKQPETDEEKQILAQAQQSGNQPGADMVLAMAEMKKADAMMLKEQREAAKAQADMQIAHEKVQVEGFKAQTGRIDSQVKAQTAGADINMKQIESFGKQLDNTVKIKALRQPAGMADQDLLTELFTPPSGRKRRATEATR